MQSIPNNALVVVADGNGARVFRNTGKPGDISLTQDEVLDPIAMNGPAGSAPNEMSTKQLEEATFAKQLAEWLNAGALKNAYADLVVIADPQTLGRLRPLLHKETSQRLVGELAKTLTNAPLADIERSLTAAA